jgi:hypothetical protein
VKAWKAQAPVNAAAKSDLAKLLVELDAWEKRFLSRLDVRLKELRGLELSLGLSDSKADLAAIRRELGHQLHHSQSEARELQHKLARLDEILTRLEGFAHRLEHGAAGG